MKNECHRMLSFTRKQTVCARVWYRYLHRFGRFVANMTCSHVLHDGAVGPGGECGARVIVVQRRKVGLGAMCPPKPICLNRIVPGHMKFWLAFCRLMEQTTA